MLKQLLTLCLCLLISPAGLLAKTYTIVDENGTTWFTDKQSSSSGFSQYAPIIRSPKSLSRVSCVAPGQQEFTHRLDTYSPSIQKFAKTYGVHEYLVHAIISTESCYDSNALSSVGAQGLMQLMPGTARELGVTDSFDPSQNIRAGVEYFSKLQKQFDYNSQLALAAYNAGPGAVKKYAGVPPYPETQAYVKNVLEKFRQYSVSPASLKNGLLRKLPATYHSRTSNKPE